MADFGEWQENSVPIVSDSDYMHHLLTRREELSFCIDFASMESIEEWLFFSSTCDLRYHWSDGIQRGRGWRLSYSGVGLADKAWHLRMEEVWGRDGGECRRARVCYCTCKVGQ